MIEGLKITYQELNILQKFIDNIVDYYYFKEQISKTYVMEYEIENRWEKFRENGIQFLTSGQAGEGLFNKIMMDIKEKNYKG